MQFSTAVQTQIEEAKPVDTYSLIIFNSLGTAVLLDHREGQYHLPKIEVPKFTRPAEEITTLLRNSWGLSSVFLFSDVLEDSFCQSNFATIESQDGISQHPPELDWFTIHHSLTCLLLASEERQALKKSYQKVLDRVQQDDPAPFSRLGWMRGLLEWAEKVIRPFEMELLQFRQLNACETFSLIRFDTTQYPVWFKAVGKPNLHEYEISQTLARLFPNYVPAILATRPEWHGWLMADAGGTPLKEISTPSAWQIAAETLGKLQIESIDGVNEFVDAGCRNLGLDQLFDLVDPFLGVMGDLMQQQKKSPPIILTREELNELGKTLKDALHNMAALQIPETLGHGDFNPGNIVVSPECCKFIDWAEGHVSHPFLTFEYFLSHLRREYSQLIPFEDDIRGSYSRVWRQIVSPEQIAEAFVFSPLVAVFAYAAGGYVWRDSERMKVPGFQGYLRSMTRRMKQEADLLQRRRVECLN